VKKLPIGIQSFVNIRTEGFYYVHKTKLVKMLVDEGKYFFLSRPRRFGKSLFLDTLRQAFLSRKELFEGLYLENNWDWSVEYPVIKISFGTGVHKTVDELENTKDVILRNHARDYELKLEEKYTKDRFMELIYKLYKKYSQKVVILIDEYDKPILDNIENPEIAVAMRESLKNFYSVIKDADEYLKFVFITGVTKFSKVSIFSGLNNLNDITLDPKYGTICGYTQEEFEQVFKDRLEGVNLEEVRHWYNGYNWLSERVYNPFDVLLYLDKKLLRPYWFETGTPTFLIKLLMKEKYFLPNLENLEAGDEIVGEFDIENIEATTLLFQTGYLTIKSVENTAGMSVYTLTYPNLEVKAAFNRHLLDYMVKNRLARDRNMIRLYRILEKNKIEELKELFQAFFSSIPYEWYTKNELYKYEGYYASVFYAYFAGIGFDVRVEDSTSFGKIDMTVKYKGRCYIFEFKVVEGDGKGEALKQLKEKKYHEKYMHTCDEIYLVGVEFSKKERNVVNFEYERVK